MPSSFATNPFSTRWSKKARSSCRSFSNAAKVYFSSASASAALSERSANAISGSIIQNSARWRLVFEFSAPHAGSGLGSLFTPKMLAERSVDARLPARSASAKPIDHVLVETQRYELLGRVGRRPAASAPDQPIADMEIGLVEPLVGQLGD